MTSVRHRISLLVMTVAIVLIVTACGRATDEEINQALGITPAPTHEAVLAASGTAPGAGTAQSGAGGASPVVALGDVTKGKRQFSTWCAGCHSPAGPGPDIRAPGSAGSSVSVESLTPLIRDGKGHPTPPGPFKPTEISNSQIADIAAYLHSEASS